MKDVSLDDLIKEDKKKKFQIRKNQKGNKNQHEKKGHKNNGPPKRKLINNRDNQKFKRENDNDRRPRTDKSEHKRGRFGKLKGKRLDKGNNPNDIHDKSARPPRKQNNDDEPARQRGRTLRVLGLHPDFTNEDLNKLFATHGALEKCLIEQDNFGRSLTTAIVRYHGAEAAKNAIQGLNQHKVMNSILTVQPYKRIKK